jgi:hypothetical protein
MASFLQLISLLIGVGILGYVAFKLMAHEQIIKRSAAKIDRMIVTTYESVSTRLDSNNRMEKGNSEMLLMIEDLRREISEREL